MSNTHMARETTRSTIYTQVWYFRLGIGDRFRCLHPLVELKNKVILTSRVKHRLRGWPLVLQDKCTSFTKRRMLISCVRRHNTWIYIKSVSYVRRHNTWIYLESVSYVSRHNTWIYIESVSYVRRHNTWIYIEPVDLNQNHNSNVDTCILFWYFYLIVYTFTTYYVHVIMHTFCIYYHGLGYRSDNYVSSIADLSVIDVRPVHNKFWIIKMQLYIWLNTRFVL